MARLQTTKSSPAKFLLGLLLVGCLLFTLCLALLYALRFKEPVYDGKKVTEWVAQLSTNRADHHNYIEAEQALKALGPKAVPSLERQLTGARSSWEKMYLKVHPRLPTLLQDKSSGLVDPSEYFKRQLAAISVLQMLGTNAVSAASALGHMMRGDNILLGSAAAQALASMGRFAVPELIAALDHPSYIVKANACMALRTIGSEAAPAARKLGELLESSNPDEPPLAATTMSRLGAAAIPVLTQKLQHTNSTVKFWAVHGLTWSGPAAATAVPELLNLVNDPDPKIRAKVIEALCALSMMHSSVDSALVQALDDPAVEVRRKSLEGIASSRPRLAMSHLPKIIQFLKDEDMPSRTFAARALGSIVSKSPDAVRHLEELLNDSEGTVRLEAYYSLYQIDPKKYAHQNDLQR